MRYRVTFSDQAEKKMMRFSCEIATRIRDKVMLLERVINPRKFLRKVEGLYIWLKNPSSLTKKQLKELGGLKEMNLKTVRAYSIKLSLQEFWELEDRQSAEVYFKKWYFWATHYNLPAIIKAAKF